MSFHILLPSLFYSPVSIFAYFSDHRRFLHTLRRGTALFVTGALLLMFVTVGLLYVQFRSGRFKI